MNIQSTLLLGLACIVTPSATAQTIPPNTIGSAGAKPTEVQQNHLDQHGDSLPAGALARLGTIRFRHGDRIRTLAFSPDGKKIASAGADRLVRFWDSATGKELHVFRGHPSEIHHLAFSPDGERLATTARDGKIRLWRVASGMEDETVIAVAKKTAYLGPVIFSKDGNTLIAGNHPHGIDLLDAANGKRLRQMSGHTEPIQVLALSASGKHLVSGSHDKTVLVWDLESGEVISRLAGQTREIYGVAISPDGKLIASVALGDPDLRLWDVATAKELRQLHGKWGFLSVDFSPDGKSLITGGQDGLVRIWDVATGNESRKLGDLTGGARAFPSPNGKKVAAFANQLLRLWDAETGKELFPPEGHTQTVWSVALAPDGRTAATAEANPGCVRFWNLSTGEELRRCEGHVGRGGGIVFTLDGKGLFAIGKNGDTTLFDVATAKEIRRFQEAPHSADSRALSPDGKWFVTVSLDGLRGWDVASGKLTWSPVKGHSLKSVAFSPDSKQLATGGWNAPVLLWDVATGKIIHRLDGHTGSVYCVAFSPDGKTLASSCCNDRGFANAAEDRNILLWDVSTRREQRRFGGHAGGYYQLEFSGDGRMLMSAGHDGTVRLWETLTGKERRSFHGHQGPVNTATLSPGGRVLLSGSADTTAIVWDVTGIAIGGRLPQLALSSMQLADLWSDLEDGDVGRAYQSHWKLIAGAEHSVPWIRARLQPAPAADGKRMTSLIAALDSGQFARRQEATQELERLGDVAETALRDALRGDATVEKRRRIQQLLEKLKITWTTPAKLRVLRSLEVLEQIATPDARRVLEAVAAGPPGARLTEEAKASLAIANKNRGSIR